MTGRCHAARAAWRTRSQLGGIRTASSAPGGELGSTGELDFSPFCSYMGHRDEKPSSWSTDQSGCARFIRLAFSSTRLKGTWVVLFLNPCKHIETAFYIWSAFGSRCHFHRSAGTRSWRLLSVKVLPARASSPLHVRAASWSACMVSLSIYSGSLVSL